jgi:hypothetical protein
MAWLAVEEEARAHEGTSMVEEEGGGSPKPLPHCTRLAPTMVDLHGWERMREEGLNGRQRVAAREVELCRRRTPRRGRGRCSGRGGSKADGGMALPALPGWEKMWV